MPAKKVKTPVRRQRPKVATPKPRPRRHPAGVGKVDPSKIEIVATKGTPGKGGGEGGHAWTIFAEGQRAGTVFINLIDEAPIGLHPSIQIYLNQKNQGRGIGRMGYRLAAEASRYDTIFAHMRKSNIASKRAAEEAGFRDASPASFAQLIMRWDRRG